MRQHNIMVITGMVLLLLLSTCGRQDKKQEKKQEKKDVKVKVNQEQTETKQKEQKEWLPEIVPYLNSKPSSSDGQGKAVIKPLGPFPAGSRVDFQIVFTVGSAGIAPGGFILLQISPWWGWSHPQDVSPENDGFISVIPSFTDSSLQVKILSMHRVLVFSQKHKIKPGTTITFNYTRAYVDKFAETEELFMIFVDADGDGHSACIPNPPIVQITAREPVRLSVNAPPQANPGETIDISATPLDALGNWGKFPEGIFTLTIIQNDAVIGEKNIHTKGNEKKITFNYKLPGEGIYFFPVKGPSQLQGKSNVTLCQAGIPKLKLYFGDVHGHSRLSDGTGTPESYYQYARDVSGLNIAALTDHADYGLTPIKDKVWKRIKDAANDSYSPGQYVTLVAFEWTNWNFGHRNVYYRDGDGPVFRSIDKISDTPEKLWRQISSYEVMTVGHHVGGGPVPIDWSVPPGPKEWLVEICSIHGSSEYYGCEASIYNPQEGHFVLDALSRGYKLGIMASGDTHDGHPGQRTGNVPVNGLIGVYAENLTREAVWEAFKKRRVYGTSGPKIILNFRVGDAPMGSKIKWPKSKGPLPIVLRTVCCEDIEKIDIIRSGVPIFMETGEKIDGVFAVFLIEDPEPSEGTSWYYARIVQKDGNIAWSSPIWVTAL